MFFQNRAKLWLFASALLALAHLAWNYGALPEKMPSHFGPDGHADGWMTKAAYAQLEIGLIAGMTALFIGIGWLIKVVPADAVNIPNRDYWLAPARRAETIRKMSGEMAGFGAALNVFLLGVQDQNIRAALSGTNRLGQLFTVYLVGFLVYTGVWVVGLYRRWGRG
jgi:uncharacterized membrane protein